MEKCITPTDKCMWKHLCDVPNGVKTRSKAKNEEVDRYFAVKYFIHRWVMWQDSRFFVK